MDVSIVLTQLPSCLEESPLYESYDQFITGAFDQFQRDLESFCYAPSGELIERRISGIYSPFSINRKPPLNEMEWFERLVAACSWSDDPVGARRWLHSVAARVVNDGRSLTFPGLCLITRPYRTTAYIYPYETNRQTPFPGGESSELAAYHRSAWFRRGISERDREYLSDQRLARWFGRENAS